MDITILQISLGTETSCTWSATQVTYTGTILQVILVVGYVAWNLLAV